MGRRIMYIIIPVLSLCVVSFVHAAMTGSSYKIPWDAWATGGGENTSGSVYVLDSTVGEILGDQVTGTTYAIRAGYRQEDRPYLQTTISASSCSFGTYSTSFVQACRLTLTTSTSAPGGYVVTVKNVGYTSDTTTFTPVADGSITAGSEEYGVSTEDTGVDISTFTVGDITSSNCTNGLPGPLTTFSPLSSLIAKSIVSHPGPVLDQAVDICFGSSIAIQTNPAAYVDTITLISTGTY